MAVAFDATSNSGFQATPTSTYSWSHTCTGANRYLVVGVSMLSAAGASVSTLKYATVSMTLLRARASATGAVRVEVWGLAAPATGANDVEVVLSVGLDSASGAVSFTDVNQASSTEGINDASATSDDITVDVTTVTDGAFVIDTVTAMDMSITVGAGQTSRWNLSNISGSGAGSTEGPNSPAGAVTMSWTDGGPAVTWTIVGLAIKPTAAAADHVLYNPWQQRGPILAH